MEHFPITLGIARPKPGSSRKQSGAGKPGSSSAMEGKLPKDLKQKIFERDEHTCQCCGFQSKKYQEVLHKNFDPSDTSEKNLITTCIFCHQCFHLDAVSAMKSGVLVWLPEIDQAMLHHIARAIYIARISQGPVAEAARKSLDVIMGRREEAKKRIYTDDPFILASVLSDYLGPKHYDARKEKLEGLRLFPLDRRIIKEADLEFNQFPQILAYWRSKDGPFGGKTPPQWISIYQQLNIAA
ncbi:MAG TPA: type IV secretion protein DotN [Alphaproteobacteria bacterium]|nr:HNH endonuclease [Alphaproteobacteria bacterium]USO05167.1 MAG: HNH endonuclease [Rhodospirillales bacterium]HOO81488.1 type IV secretion protein DotN [Alphaproteobacteria bacterium]